ncbi:Mth938-like domain-containing protein [Candidatus Margulisiibacteriota bacterium]
MIKKSPKILNLSWASMDIEGLGKGKDFILYPGGGCAWDWTKTCTEHSPGIQPADVELLIEKGSEVIILSQGMYSRLQVCKETIELLQAKGIEYHILDTKAAVALYNSLVDTKAVGGLFHSTC